MSQIYTRPAQSQDLAAVAELFDAYRQFYAQAPDIKRATEFIQQRLQRQDSTILVALNAEDSIVGFCQLYPSFCSVIAAPIAVLYDLYVTSQQRQSGAGKTLMQAARAYAETQGWARLDLTTAKDNFKAQKLYESQGWIKDEVFLSYNLNLA
jgi:ribosomal protein S18 acetylase RimI-like enzyme